MRKYHVEQIDICLLLDLDLVVSGLNRFFQLFHADLQTFLNYRIVFSLSHQIIINPTDEKEHTKQKTELT